MSRFQSAFCRSAPWRGFARRVVMPWALQGFVPQGDVLEIGAGSGAMAAELLAMHRSVRLTVTDYDHAMVDAAAARLSSFGDRVSARQADATALPFADSRFDVVLSWVMLHHTVEWERALAEAIRVLRPGGQLVGYDLLATAPLRLLHPPGNSDIRVMGLGEFRHAVDALPIDKAAIARSLAGSTVRFSLRKAAPETHQ
jgi:ubiquinone/menaquinone biosynthesis C-methylase UbiE